jgi:hypothetical protein
LIYIVMEDFYLFNKRYKAGDIFNAEYWSNDTVQGLVEQKRIEQVQVEADDHGSDDATESSSGSEQDAVGGSEFQNRTPYSYS